MEVDRRALCANVKTSKEFKVIDRVAIRLPDATFPLEILPSLTTIRGTSGEGVAGDFKGFRVAQWENAVTIKGSLGKYLNGDNFQTLSREGVREALTRIEDETGLPLRDARVFQLETGFTFPVTKPPREFLAAWYSFGHYQKNVFNSGETVELSLKSHRRHFIGYDKGAEAGKLPADYPAPYALRLELSDRSGVGEILGEALSPWALCTDEVYNALRARFQKFYFRIPKRREAISMKGIIAKPSQFFDTMALIGLQAYGMDNALAFVSEAQRRGEIEKRAATRIRT